MVIDTNVFIEYLRTPKKENTVFHKLPPNIQYSISSVTLFELYIGATSPEKENDIRMLTNNLSIILFDHEVAHKAADIYRKLKRNSQLIEFRDIFIAATCLVHNQSLITLNRRHLSRIEELNLF